MTVRTTKSVLVTMSDCWRKWPKPRDDASPMTHARFNCMVRSSHRGDMAAFMGRGSGDRSEFLREPHQERPPLAELGRAHADAQAVTDLVAVIEQVDRVKTDLRALAEP